jgi:hypothetical protein
VLRLIYSWESEEVGCEWTNLVITCLDKKVVLVKVFLSVVKVPC